jgi:hypothetical protein
MNGYVTANVLAERWDVTVRQVEVLCKEGKIEGAAKFGAAWGYSRRRSETHTHGKA